MSTGFLTTVMQTSAEHWGVEEKDWRGFVPEWTVFDTGRCGPRGYERSRKLRFGGAVSEYTQKESACWRDV